MKKILSIMTVVTALVLGVTTQAEAKHWEQKEPSRVRVLHASPDAPAVDVYVNDAKAVSNLSYPNITGYLELERGTYNIRVVPAGAMTPVVINTEVTVKSGRDYTIAATGKLASITAQVYMDKNKHVDEDEARVRVIHLSPDAPEVKVTTEDGKRVSKNVSFGESSKYKKVEAGEYNLQVRVADTDDVALNLPDTNLEGGKTYTAFAIGEASKATLSAKLVVDSESEEGEE
jgi:hypothetical protein